MHVKPSLLAAMVQFREGNGHWTLAFKLWEVGGVKNDRINRIDRIPESTWQVYQREVDETCGA